MIKAYSYKERKIVPMLEEHEWKEIEPYITDSIKMIKDYRAKTGCGIKEAKETIETKMEQIYFELTGEKVNSYEEVYYRRRADFGPLCNKCEKPYRTPKATFCAECGNIN